jgi:hypothetical protein
MNVRTKNEAPACPHGTLGGYKNWGCGCEPCRKANRDYQNRYNQGHRSARKQVSSQAGKRIWLLSVREDLRREQRSVQERISATEAALEAVEKLLAG